MRRLILRAPAWFDTLSATDRAAVYAIAGVIVGQLLVVVIDAVRGGPGPFVLFGL